MAACKICQEAATNPICPDCIEKEIAAWLIETRPDLVPGLQRKTDELYDGSGETKCIICNQNVGVCSYCYTKEIFKWLDEYEPDLPEFLLLKNFNHHFHY
ncbi:MAG: hypothetical protein ABIC91_06550 [Nanoarchaeota archaeon]|nr:hypothetical protein [Nanoarchaeota archaeon]MBU1030606.1 hypothetical protein [Nanoarchaeota archaeon]MBU1849836.1 hypothetical protein [Nanoarchaeota archaeon]